MVEAYIVLDESGAKGKSNKNEQSEGEFGVVAGFLCSVGGYKYFEEVARDISQKTDFAEENSILRIFQRKNQMKLKIVSFIS
ncbi:hypothetical protein HJ058_22830 [Vibrio parahaemolyticus]|nr:hypothetical protein [Vibrio parahaemolyticus]